MHRMASILNARSGISQIRVRRQTTPSSRIWQLPPLALVATPVFRQTAAVQPEKPHHSLGLHRFIHFHCQAAVVNHPRSLKTSSAPTNASLSLNAVFKK